MIKNKIIKGDVIMQEIWKPVNGFENLYEISNKGNLKALEKSWMAINYKSKTYHKITFREKMIKPSISKCGYKQVILCKNNKTYGKTIHKLVAEAFIPNIENKKCVNHIDGNKLNNNVNNLEWCTHKENSKHSWENGLEKSYLKGKKGKLHNTSKSVNQYDKDGNFIRNWDCISDIKRELNIDSGRISKCCKHYKYCNTAGGYIWEYKL